jgi:hypothetical protein
MTSARLHYEHRPCCVHTSAQSQGMSRAALDAAEIKQRWDDLQLVHLPAAEQPPSPGAVETLIRTLRTLAAAERAAGGGSIHKTWTVENKSDVLDGTLRDPMQLLQLLEAGSVVGGGRWYVSAVVQDTGSKLNEVLRCLPYVNKETCLPSFLLPVRPSAGGEQQSVATAQAAREWSHPPCRRFKTQSCFCLALFLKWALISPTWGCSC